MKDFGSLKNGQKVTLYVLQNDQIKVAISDYGASLISIWVKDKNGTPQDVVLGFEDASGYEQDNSTYIGCNVGRFANRVNNAKFTLNDKTYLLDKNEGENTLHSGFHPYSKRIWEVKSTTEDSISLSLNSPDGDQGFPGDLDLTITYRVEGNALKIIYDGICNKDTMISLTNHSYFNLNGQGNGDVLNHIVKINADYFIPIDARSIPTGEISSVKGTPMDFTQPKEIGKEIEADFEQLKLAKGYDHNWCINDYDGSVREAVVAKSDQTGIQMTVLSNYPGIQMYTGNYLQDTPGKNGAIYDFRNGICFEAQYYPDAVNNEQFVSPICKANEPYHKEIIFQFD